MAERPGGLSLEEAVDGDKPGARMIPVPHEKRHTRGHKSMLRFGREMPLNIE